MNKIIRIIINSITNTSTLKIVWICWGIALVFLILPAAVPQNSILGLSITRFLFIIFGIFFGIGGIPIVVRKEYPFPIMYRYTKIEASIYGWVIIASSIFVIGGMIYTFFI